MTRFALVDTLGRIFQTGPMADAETMFLFANDPDYTLRVIEDTDEPVSGATHYWDGTRFSLYPPCPGNWAAWNGTEWVDPRTAADHLAELLAAREAALNRITTLRGQARLAYITDLPGQDMLYMAKAEEARAYLADPDPDPADYPLVLSEVGITAPTAYEVAQVFTNLNAMWRRTAGSLDAACFQAEAAVQQAPDAATIDAILADLAAGLIAPG